MSRVDAIHEINKQVLIRLVSAIRLMTTIRRCLKSGARRGKNNLPMRLINVSFIL